MEEIQEILGLNSPVVVSGKRMGDTSSLSSKILGSYPPKYSKNVHLTISTKPPAEAKTLKFLEDYFKSPLKNDPRARLRTMHNWSASLCNNVPEGGLRELLHLSMAKAVWADLAKIVTQAPKSEDFLGISAMLSRARPLLPKLRLLSKQNLADDPKALAYMEALVDAAENPSNNWQVYIVKLWKGLSSSTPKETADLWTALMMEEGGLHDEIESPYVRLWLTCKFFLGARGVADGYGLSEMRDKAEVFGPMIPKALRELAKANDLEKAWTLVNAAEYDRLCTDNDQLECFQILYGLLAKSEQPVLERVRFLLERREFDLSHCEEAKWAVNKALREAPDQLSLALLAESRGLACSEAFEKSWDSVRKALRSNWDAQAIDLLTRLLEKRGERQLHAKVLANAGNDFYTLMLRLAEANDEVITKALLTGLELPARSKPKPVLKAIQALAEQVKDKPHLRDGMQVLWTTFFQVHPDENYLKNALPCATEAGPYLEETILEAAKEAAKKQDLAAVWTLIGKAKYDTLCSGEGQLECLQILYGLLAKSETKVCTKVAKLLESRECDLSACEEAKAAIAQALQKQPDRTKQLTALARRRGIQLGDLQQQTAPKTHQPQDSTTDPDAVFQTARTTRDVIQLKNLVRKHPEMAKSVQTEILAKAGDEFYAVMKRLAQVKDEALTRALLTGLQPPDPQDSAGVLSVIKVLAPQVESEWDLDEGIESLWTAFERAKPSAQQLLKATQYPQTFGGQKALDRLCELLGPKKLSDGQAKQLLKRAVAENTLDVLRLVELGVKHLPTAKKKRAFADQDVCTLVATSIHRLFDEPKLKNSNKRLRALAKASRKAGIPCDRAFAGTIEAFQLWHGDNASSHEALGCLNKMDDFSKLSLQEAFDCLAACRSADQKRALQVASRIFERPIEEWRKLKLLPLLTALPIEKLEEPQRVLIYNALLFQVKRKPEGKNVLALLGRAHDLYNLSPSADDTAPDSTYLDLAKAQYDTDFWKDLVKLYKNKTGLTKRQAVTHGQIHPLCTLISLKALHRRSDIRRGLIQDHQQLRKLDLKNYDHARLRQATLDVLQELLSPSELNEEEAASVLLWLVSKEHPKELDVRGIFTSGLCELIEEADADLTLVVAGLTQILPPNVKHECWKRLERASPRIHARCSTLHRARELREQVLSWALVTDQQLDSILSELIEIYRSTEDQLVLQYIETAALRIYDTCKKRLLGRDLQTIVCDSWALSALACSRVVLDGRAQMRHYCSLSVPPKIVADRPLAQDATEKLVSLLIEEEEYEALFEVMGQAYALRLHTECQKRLEKELGNCDLGQLENAIIEVLTELSSSKEEKDVLRYGQLVEWLRNDENPCKLDVAKILAAVRGEVPKRAPTK